MSLQTNPTENKLHFGIENPVAVVTGSGGPRVGRCVAERFRDAGFRVVLHAHRSVKIAKELLGQWQADGFDSHLIEGDVSDENRVQSWRDEILARYGRIDVLVNSSAIWDPKPLELQRAADYENFFRINALGMALMNQHLGLQMTVQPLGGAIINIGDWATVRPYRNFAAYFPSKSAVIGITQSMAVELAIRNPQVRVNAILPGPVMLAEEIDRQRRQRIIDECLLKREGTPGDVAHAAMFLATSPFVTGVCLPVDGGRTIYAGQSADAIAHPKIDNS
jgi:pteridine reductase